MQIERKVVQTPLVILQKITKLCSSAATIKLLNKYLYCRTITMPDQKITCNSLTIIFIWNMFIYQKNAMFRINLITRLLVARKGKDVDFLAIII